MRACVSSRSLIVLGRLVGSLARLTLNLPCDTRAATTAAAADRVPNTRGATGLEAERQPKRNSRTKKLAKKHCHCNQKQNSSIGMVLSLCGAAGAACCCSMALFTEQSFFRYRIVSGAIASSSLVACGIGSSGAGPPKRGRSV